MNRIWLESYPPGTPSEIQAHACSSLVELLAHSCARFSDKAAFTSMGVSLTYGEIDRYSRSFAAYLTAALGLEKGDRFAIMLPNLLQYPVALFGALRAGLAVVNINPLYTAGELAQQLSDSGAKAILVLENFAHTLAEALSRDSAVPVITTAVGDLFSPARRLIVNAAMRYLKRMVPPWHIRDAVSFRTSLSRGARLSPGNVSVRPDDIAFIQYTGGTTGRPKGAVLSHANMVANVEQTTAWIGNVLAPGKETVITALPLYHVFALTANLLVFVKLGGRNVLVVNPRDMAGLVALLRKTRYTAITGVNTLFSALLDRPDFRKASAANAGALKIAVAGGMAVQRSVAERWQAATGVALTEGYGLTEASPIVCSNRFDAKTFSGRLGLPLPSTEVAIMDEQGDEVPIGEPGEICVRGPQVMRGYWNAPEESAKAFTAGGWLRTGDIGHMDERGYVTFHDRRKDVIVISGFKAYPAEIEDVAKRHPGVKDAGAVGVPDERSGEAVALFVVRSDPQLTAAALLEHCARHLTGYKLPKRIEFRDQLPKSAIGKVLRRALKDEVAGAHG